MQSVDFMFSERQQKMLGALFLHPHRRYGTNELISIGGAGVGAGRAVINAFEKAGVVIRRSRGNQVVYSVNIHNPIYPELRSICLKTFGLSYLVRRELEALKDRIDLAFIFGSVVHGRERPDSDVDLMVVGELDLFDLGEAIERMQSQIGRVVDVNLHTPQEWEALKRDRVIMSIMKDEKIMVIGE